jgi:hypothetical protein
VGMYRIGHRPFLFSVYHRGGGIDWRGWMGFGGFGGFLGGSWWVIWRLRLRCFFILEALPPNLRQRDKSLWNPYWDAFSRHPFSINLLLHTRPIPPASPYSMLPAASLLLSLAPEQCHNFLRYLPEPSRRMTPAKPQAAPSARQKTFCFFSLRKKNRLGRDTHKATPKTK